MDINRVLLLQPYYKRCCCGLNMSSKLERLETILSATVLRDGTFKKCLGCEDRVLMNGALMVFLQECILIKDKVSIFPSLMCMCSCPSTSFPGMTQ
jgi:hypothetical protein